MLSATVPTKAERSSASSALCVMKNKDIQDETEAQSVPSTNGGCVYMVLKMKAKALSQLVRISLISIILS